jgi:drug/metabolite transporter (DMT)-like permease
MVGAASSVLFLFGALITALGATAWLIQTEDKVEKVVEWLWHHYVVMILSGLVLLLLAFLFWERAKVR